MSYRGSRLPVGYGMATPVRCGLVFSPEFVIDGRVTTNPVRPGHAPSGYPQGAHGPAGPAELAEPGPARARNAQRIRLRAARLRPQPGRRARGRTGRPARRGRRADPGAPRPSSPRSDAGPSSSSGSGRPPSDAPAARRPREGDSAQGFGYRAERLLRMAEAEANEIRGSAIKEAAEIVERARAAAEMHRHEIEQNLIMRATTLDQQANELASRCASGSRPRPPSWPRRAPRPSRCARRPGTRWSRPARTSRSWPGTCGPRPSAGPRSTGRRRPPRWPGSSSCATACRTSWVSCRRSCWPRCGPRSERTAEDAPTAEPGRRRTSGRSRAEGGTPVPRSRGRVGPAAEA